MFRPVPQIFRAITHIEKSPEQRVTLVTLECGHIGRYSSESTYELGQIKRCYRCNKDAEPVNRFTAG